MDRSCHPAASSPTLLSYSLPTAVYNMVFASVCVYVACDEQIHARAVGGEVEQKRIQPDKEVTLQHKSKDMLVYARLMEHVL